MGFDRVRYDQESVHFEAFGWKKRVENQLKKEEKNRKAKEKAFVNMGAKEEDQRIAEKERDEAIARRDHLRAQRASAESRISKVRRRADIARQFKSEIEGTLTAQVGLLDAARKISPNSVTVQTFCAMGMRELTNNNVTETRKLVEHGGTLAKLILYLFSHSDKVCCNSC